MSLGERVVDLLKLHGVDVAETGSNVAKGNVNIQCPWCGADDPSHHLGINLNSGKFGCWRNADHRGKDPSRLVAEIFGWTRAKAKQELGMGSGRDQVVDKAPDVSLVDAVEGTFDTKKRHLSRVRAYARAGQSVSSLRSDTVPSGLSSSVICRKGDVARARTKEGNYLRDAEHPCDILKGLGVFRSILASSSASLNPYLHYLRKRRIGPRMRRVYQLTAALTGDYTGRILIPIRDETGRWVSFTGRAIHDNKLRYRTLDDAQALKPARELIWNYDRALQGGHTLVVTEGPFDAMRIDGCFLSDVRAVAVLTASLTPEKVATLWELKKLYRQIVFVLDEGFELQAMALAAELSSPFAKVPYGKKDLGELHPLQAQQWAVSLTRRR